jgi:hypothetical protein
MRVSQSLGLTVDTPQQKHPWDQWPGESDPAYARFTAYLSLGPSRSLEAAYQAMLPKQERASEGVKRRRPPGQWYRDSGAYCWVKRALAWDIANMAAAGDRATAAYVHAVQACAARVVESLTRLPGPADWKEFLETLKTLAALIPAETVASVRDTPPEHLPGQHPDNVRTVGG